MFALRMVVLSVSIHARHCWRAMPAGRALFPACRPCFNPRPPLLAGDALQALGVLKMAVVSIHARHCWRAMRFAAGLYRSPRWVSIHARHCWRAMPSGQKFFTKGFEFQSTPAIAGGRCAGVGQQRSRHSGFNPRPPLLAGDAGASGLEGAGFVVSIHARHCWRAMPVTWGV